jgi:ATP-dependent exoDNAse (exonuclease V) beta subunit
MTRAALPSTGVVDAAPLADHDLGRVTATGDDESAAGRRESGPAISDRAVGTLVHRMFQRQVPVSGLAQLAERAAALIRTGDDEVSAGTEDIAVRAAEIYHAMRQRPEVTSLLASGDVYYEVPFSLRFAAPDRIVRGQIDGVVVPLDGPIVVVEFKTGRPQPGHDAQVSVYRQALATAWPGRGVETRLFYFQSGNPAR